ncbi:MAG TPA: phage/plasmid primase, P4 family [Herbaspirillum sp.]|jgi:putative DNA primase/helicase
MNRAFDPHTYAKALHTAGNIASESRLLYQWTGTHWRALSEEEAEREAYLWLAKNADGHASASNAHQAVRSAILFQPPLPSITEAVVVPVQNGYVVLLDDGALELVEPDKSLGIRHVLNCTYAPDAQAPIFMSFLQRALPDVTVQARVQEYIGYTFLADARFQRAQLWLGDGANGKGVLANIVQSLHGNVAAIHLDALEGFRLSTLVGANLIYADEVPRGRINEQLLKSMIAGERIQIDRKYRDPLSVCLRGKWIVCGNHLPVVADHSVGFWRRWDIVPFGKSIPERERDALLVSRIVKSELSGVMNWALQGLIRLLGRGNFSDDIPHSMRAAVRDAKAETNSVAAWIDDCDVEIGGAVGRVKGEVFQHYRKWCDDNALQTLGSVQFWKRLRDMNLGYAEERRRTATGQQRVCNVRL